MAKREDTRLTIALCGNPNCGKTTLFNRLTGSNQKVGNWPGVTVEQKTGYYLQDNSVAIVDTPGAYSLNPYALDEKITAQFLADNRPDIIINVVDCTNLERSLLLTTQLLEKESAVVVALNMADEAAKHGVKILPDVLEKEFGCKFFLISASKNVGIDALMNYCCVKPARRSKPLHLANKQTDSEAIRERYNIIKEIIGKAVKTDCSKEQKASKPTLTERIDKIVLNKWLAYPIFFAIMLVIFYLSIGSVGKLLASVITDGLTPFIKNQVTNLLTYADTPWLTSLIVDGVISGVMSVIGFLPQIMILFGLISVLEASGYMSRIAFITDRLLNKIGLGGRSFVAMILGCGCSTPAILSCRVIKDIRERNATITLAPFMPCSAKLAVISFFTANIFDGNALIAVSFYVVSIFAVILGGLVLKLLCRKHNEFGDAFIMELPTYRAPKATNVLKQMRERGKAFLLKAGTIIFAASIVLWMLTNFDFRFNMTDTQNSMLAEIGKFICPVFTPLGFNDGGYGWQFTVATLSGVVAKETVITTLGILLPNGIADTVSTLGAYCFVTYNLLTIPCIAAISASFAEQGGWKNGLKSMAFQLATAYAVTLAIYQIGNLIRRYTAATIITLSLLAILTLSVLSIRYIVKRHSCGGCACADCYRKCNSEKRR